MKKIFSLVAALVMLSSQAAFAETFINFYTVANDGDTVAKDTFDLNETPWLYMELPNQSETNFNFVGTIWNDPYDDSYFVAKEFNDNLGSWVSFDNWDTIKKAGTWNIQGSFLFANGVSGTGSTNFTVTPEPVSMALFGLGAGALGLKRLRRKK